MNTKSKKFRKISLLILILQFFIVVYLKYYNQFLSIKNFDPLLSGNIITFIIYFVIIIQFLLSKRSINLNYKIVLTIIFFSYLFLALGFISTVVKLPFNKFYFFGQYGNKLFTGGCFTLYLFFLIYLFFYCYFSKNNKKIFDKNSFFATILVMILFLVLAGLFISLNESEAKNYVLSNKGKKVLVVLGAAVWSDNKPSPILSARVLKAAELSNKFTFDKIYFTGGNAPGEMTEAEVAFEYFKSLNPYFENVELEKNTTSTNEQIQFIKNQIIPKYPDNEIIVISDSFHLIRIKEISKFHKIDIKTIASDFSMKFGSNLYNRIRESLALSVFWLFSI
ncbi:MAG: YdcF family protein [Ignavibacterium sp.]|nr:YdcF family protein [Ignavibacterium sp.]